MDKVERTALSELIQVCTLVSAALGKFDEVVDTLRESDDPEVRRAIAWADGKVPS